MIRNQLKNYNRQPKKLFLTFILCFSFLFVGEVGFGVEKAQAQSNTFTRQLLKRLSDLEKEMASLKGGIGEVRVNSSSNSGSLERGDRVLFADMEVRLGALDSEIRSLRGDIERILYNQKKLEENINNFKEDTEFRFSELAKSGVPTTQVLGSASPRFSQNRRSTSPTSQRGFVQTLTPQDAEALLEAKEDPEVSPTLTSDPLVTFGEVQSQSLDFEDEEDVLLYGGSAEDQYQEAFSYMQKGNFRLAERAFKEFLDQFENDDLSGNAQYWLGESFYARKDFPNAAEAFLIGLQKYSDSSKGPDSLLKLGMSLASMGQEQEACTAFGEIEARYNNLSRTLSRRLVREMERLSC
jgi:tol-pal system protein YbgF